MRKVFLILACFALLTIAAKPVPTGTIAVREGSDLRYGGSVAFDTSVDGRLGPRSGVYVTVVCMQDGQAVYQWSAGVDFAFPLVDQVGLEWDGGPAECIGALVYVDETGRDPAVAILATTGFGVTAT